MNGERKLAMFMDFENIARGVKEAQYKQFELKLVLERLLEKGKIIVRRAYADWNRFTEYKRPFHEWAIELIDVPQSRYSGKNSADIRMVVDALDLAYGKTHIDSFVLVSGDSDFSPLVSKLRENDRYVIGLGVKSSSSDLLVANCDEFIFYEDLIRDTKKTRLLSGMPEKKAEAMAQLIDAIQALERENKETLWGSMVKQTMIRKNPAFNESYYGYSTFSKLLEEAAKQKIVTLERDEKSGTYIITSLTEEGSAGSDSSNICRTRASFDANVGRSSAIVSRLDSLRLNVKGHGNSCDHRREVVVRPTADASPAALAASESTPTIMPDKRRTYN